MKAELKVAEDERLWNGGYKRQKSDAEEEKRTEERIKALTQQLQAEFAERKQRVLALVAAEDELERRDTQGQLGRAAEALFPQPALIAAHRHQPLNLTRILLLRCMEQERAELLQD